MTSRNSKDDNENDNPTNAFVHEPSCHHPILVALVNDIPPYDSSRSVQQRLRYWKKKTSLNVEDIVIDNKNMNKNCNLDQIIRDGFSILHEHYMQVVDTPKNGNATTPNSTQHSISQIIVVIRFVQFLLTLNPNSIHDNDVKQQKGEGVAFSSNTIQPGEIMKMTLTLLQSLSRYVRALVDTLRKNNIHDGDHHASTIVTFALGSYLRGINPHVNDRPFLLLPLWKGICDMAVLLKSSSSETMDIDNNETAIVRLPIHELFVEAVAVLTQYISDGYSQLLQMETTACTQNRRTLEDTKVFQTHVKMIIFLIARMGVLLPRILLQDDQDNTKDIENNASTNTVVLDAITTLFKLRGLGTATRICGEQQQKQQGLGVSHDNDTGNNHKESILTMYDQLSQKVETCLLSKLILLRQPSQSAQSSLQEPPQKSSFLHHEATTTFLKANNNTDQSSSRKEVAVPEEVKISNASFSLGKLLTLHKIFQEVHTKIKTTPTSDSSSSSDIWDENMETLLIAVCEEFLFQTLPQCHHWCTTRSAANRASSMLLNESIELVASIIFQCHILEATQPSSESPTDGSGGDDHRTTHYRLHGLLVRWLAPPAALQQKLHPLCREALVSVIYLNCLWLCQLNHNARGEGTQRTSPRSVGINLVAPTSSLAKKKPFLKLLATLVFDPRTRTEHRRNIAGVLVRMMTGKDNKSNNDNININSNCNNTQGGKDLLDSTITEVVHALMSYLKLKDKNTRSHHDQKKNQEHNKRRKLRNAEGVSYHRISSLSIDDLLILWTVVERLPMASSYQLGPLLQKEIHLFCESIVVRSEMMVSGRPAAGVFLLLASLIGSVRDRNSTSNSSKAFQDFTNQRLLSVRDGMIAWLIKKWNQMEDLASLPKEHAVVSIGILRFLSNIFECLGHSSSPMDRIPQMENMITLLSKHTINTLTTTPRLDQQQHQNGHAARVVFEIGSLLQVIPAIVTPSCRKRVFQTIANTYKAMLESRSWSVVASSMSSLVRFASTIPSTHSEILPRCFPAGLQPLLQCRIQGRVQGKERISWDFDHYHCSQILLGAKQPSAWRRSKFPTKSDLSILPGSYIMKMPTRGDRSAIVIFPPTKDSIGDIKYMLGEDGTTETNYAVHSLHCVLVKNNGGGCHFVTKEC